MKPAFRMVALIGVQILLVLLLARLVRNTSPFWGGMSAHAMAAIAYGIPATVVLVTCLVFVRPLRKGVLNLVAAVFVATTGHLASLIALQQTDMWFTARFIRQMQARLLDDPRFQNVRLIGYSNDYVLFPYIPIGGSVMNEEDLRALNRLLKESHPPASAGTGSYLIRKSQEK